MSADIERRFGGVTRLYGPEATDRLRAAHVCIVGIGGLVHGVRRLWLVPGSAGLH